MTEFEKGLRRMFSTIWDCKIDHPAWQDDTVGDLMRAVIQLHEFIKPPDRSTDLISKHEAIKALGEEPLIWGDNDDYSLGQFNQWESDIKALDALPSVKNELPERPKGHWIDTGSGQECSECGEVQYGYDNFRYYCAKCGSDNRGK